MAEFRRADALVGLTPRQRRDREREAAALLRDSSGVIRTASSDSSERDLATWGGIAAFSAADFKPMQPGEPVDMVVCARFDLEHPLYFADNLVAACADCGCDLQHRPASPPHGDRVCLCCAAERVREDNDAAP
jgi:hypothetical protein